jgi:hypothetical protein
MNMTALNRPASLRHSAVFALLLAGSLVAAYALPGAQAPAKKALTIDDYTKWRSIAGQKISGDGKWVACTLALTNTIAAEAKPVLHILNLETSADVTVDDATDADFSPDSTWIAYQVDPGAAQRARASRNAASGTPPPVGGGAAQPGAPAGAPGQSGQSGQAGQSGQTGQSGRGGGAASIPPRRVELRNLATGAVRSWQDIGSFIFSPASTHLVLRRRGAESSAAAGGRGGGAPGGAARVAAEVAARQPPRARAPTRCCSTCAQAAINCSAAWPRLRSTVRASCWPSR